MSVQGWESEKHRSWNMQVEGFRGHVATDDSFVRSVQVGRVHVGWSAVQQDHDEELGPMHSMCGT